MRVFVEEVDMDWNPCPDPAKDPTIHPQRRPSPRAVRTANTPQRTDRDARHVASFPQRMT